MKGGTIIAQLQGWYFFITGIWPLFSIRTFQTVTGPKRDLWLVKTAGVLIATIGAALIVAGMKGEVASSTALLAIGSAAGLAGVDINYATRRVISKTYLLDALVEAGIILWWIVAVS